jgi:hypothetical protein
MMEGLSDSVVSVDLTFVNKKDYTGVPGYY